MKLLSAEDFDAVLEWLDKFELASKVRSTSCVSSKALGRDFSDCVLLAQVLKVLYPKLVDLHNYPPRNSRTLKMDNWTTLNRKVLTKLGLPLAADTLAQLCNAEPGVAERVCYGVMCQHRAAEQAELERQRLHGCYDDGTLENTDIMCVNVARRSGGGDVQQVVQKMVNYSLYEQSQATVHEQQQAITVLTQKIEHLDNLLKLKCLRIADLQSQLARKSCRLRPSDLLLLTTSTELQERQQQQHQQAGGDGHGHSPPDHSPKSVRSLMF